MESKNWFNKEIKDVEKELETNQETGLSAEEVVKRREKYGLNNQFLYACRVVFNEKDGYISYLNGKEFSAKLPDNLEVVKRAYFD